MTRETAMNYLKQAAEVIKANAALRKVEDEGRQLFCLGCYLYEIHMYDNNAFIDIAKALEKPIEINPEWGEENGYSKFYTPIDGEGEREWEIYTLFNRQKGWPEQKLNNTN